MVAICKRMGSKQSGRTLRIGEHQRPTQFRPSVDAGPPGIVEGPRGAGTLIPTVTSNAPQESRSRSKQSTTPSVEQSLHHARAAQARVATDRVLVELVRIAFADIGDLFDEHGTVIPLVDLPPGIRSAVAEYSIRQSRNGTRVVRVRLHSKVTALTALGRRLGMFGTRCGRATLAQALVAGNTTEAWGMTGSERDGGVQRTPLTFSALPEELCDLFSSL